MATIFTVLALAMIFNYVILIPSREEIETDFDEEN